MLSCHVQYFDRIWQSETISVATIILTKYGLSAHKPFVKWVPDIEVWRSDELQTDRPLNLSLKLRQSLWQHRPTVLCKSECKRKCHSFKSVEWFKIMRKSKHIAELTREKICSLIKSRHIHIIHIHIHNELNELTNRIEITDNILKLWMIIYPD